MPVSVLIFISVLFSFERYETYDKLKKLEHLIYLSTKTSALIHELQIERGASVGVLENSKDFLSILKEERKKVTKQVNDLTEAFIQIDSNRYDKQLFDTLSHSMNALKHLDAYRQRIDTHTITTNETITFYTELNEKLLNNIAQISKLSVNSNLSNDLVAYINFLFAKDVMGVQRAVGTTILNQSVYQEALVNQFYNLLQIREVYMKNFFIYANKESVQLYYKLLKGDDIQVVQKISNEIISSRNFYRYNEPINFNQKAQFWFENITSQINKLKKVDDYFVNQINIKTDRLINAAKIELFFIILMSCVVTFVVFILGYIISKKIHSSVEQVFLAMEMFFKYVKKEASEIFLIDTYISDEMSEKVQLLNEKILSAKNILDNDCKSLEESLSLSKLYEYAMEKSNIILRINLKKEITYANQQFYKLSGYNKEELIGQPYGYLNSVDIDNIEIEKLYRILNAGKVWRGTLKNRKKDGSDFYSIATIVPIKNKVGDILEYMQIRQDITEVINLHKELEDTQREVIYKMGEILETRNEETGNHVKVVAEYSKLLALKYGMNEDEAELLCHASPMHDIGKVGIPDSILTKPGILTPQEFEVMKNHTTIGYEIMKKSNRPIMKASSIVAHEHHEKWDGSGYPRGLKGENIHIYGRITALADVFDALGSKRSYKDAWKLNDILEFFKEQRGKHFDPLLVDIFFNNLEEFLKIRDQYK